MSNDKLSGKKILLIDDDPDFFKLTSLIFRSSGAYVITAPNGPEGIGKLFTHKPDLIILDAMMPGTDGFQICRKIRQFSNTPLMMMSAMDQDDLVLRGLEAGADDFLSKPINPDVLLARARAIIRRSANYIDNQEELIYDDGRLKIDIERHRVFICGSEVKISPIEFRLLAYLIGNAGRVISYEQILFGVWSNEHKGKYGYVHVYISHLRNKIEENPKKPLYIRSVHRVGYIFEKQGQPQFES